ncbi:MAG: glycosyltransferase family 2 protein [Thermoleophilia bacterium]
MEAAEPKPDLNDAAGGARGRVTIAILARNEEANIATAVESVVPFGDEILVIDGNSTDRTREIARSLGAVVHTDDGGGKGDGIRKAIEVASGEVLVFIDADGSHDPHDIPTMIAPILADEADLVIGSRWTGGSDELGGDISKFIRSTGSSVITLAINYRWGVHLTDSQNGFRAINIRAGRQLNLTEKIFTIEQEMMMECLRLGMRVSEVPAHEHQRQSGESQIVVWKMAWRYVWCLIRGLLKKR